MKTKKYLPILTAFWLSTWNASAQIVIDTVLVGNAGNAAQSSANRNHAQSGGDGFGSVSYDYHIGTHEVTNAQYTAFLNAVAASDPHGLWNTNMGSIDRAGISRSGSSGSYTYSVRTATSGYNNGQSMGNMPVNYVSFWDAARFTNWLTTGDTETGVYNLDPTGIANNTITRDASAWAAGGVAIASENEWYKAAYYDPTLDSGTGGYWLYATQSDTAPTATAPNNTDANSVNGDGSLSPDSDNVTPVGGYEVASSFYGTFDQSGNVWEWNDDIFSSNRVWRGGAFNNVDFILQSSFRDELDPAFETSTIGFRVSSLVAIPEPSTILMFALTGLAIGITPLYRRFRLGKGLR